MVQISSPVIAATPANITIDNHTQSVSADQAVRFSAVVKDSSGNSINEPVIWSASSGSIDSEGLFTPGKVGQTTISANSGSVNSTTTINVVSGWPIGIKSGFNFTEVSIDDSIELNATLVDRADNPVVGDLTWRCQNGEIEHTNNTWKPDEIGNATMRIIHLELETQVVFSVIPGSPKTLDIPFGLTVQSGNTQHILPIAKDLLGNEVEISKAGILTWTVENGSISPNGLYFGSYPGVWNVSVNSTSGAHGHGVIRVLPAQATGLDIEMDVEQARTGSPVILSSIRTDILGNSGEVILPLSNWTVPTGSLAMDGDSIVWTPSQIGVWTISVSDQGYSATVQVNVTQGAIVGIDFLLSEENLRSGDLIVASISAFDAAGNQRSVNGTWTIDTELGPENQGDWFRLKPGPIGKFSISATWLDNETQTVHNVENTLNITSGELARIVLPESGTRVPSDGVLNLAPIFEDEYGNILDGILVNWVVDNNEMTMEIRLAGGKWAPSSLGMHEIRAMAQGVFAITDIEVIAGTARQITTDHDGGIQVTSGEYIEIEISTLDLHGNVALATDINFQLDDPQGTVVPSSKGDGYWKISGGEVGEWNLRLTTGSATNDLNVTVSPGKAIRIMVEIPEQNPEQGSKMIIRVSAIDQAGNRIEVPNEEIDIQCTVGSAIHLSGDTYEVSIDQSGQSQSCNFYWDDLEAQRFFDANAVLFGGGLGNSDTALTIISIIIFLFISIMLVLIRRMKQDEHTNRWEIGYGEEEEDIQLVETVQTEVDVQVEEEVKTVVSTIQNSESAESANELRARLAENAKRTGVMQAAPGTTQGKTGWYIDSGGELTSWLVSESGEWTRMS
tara:strand:+ start:48 stop:2585 length:2538 start_codon:yes stop_codon:yes gene_type:complete